MFTSNSLAISYIRYSTPEQARGNSYARQLKQAEEYCKRKGLRLVEDKNYFDNGVSAYTGKNRTHGELKNLLEDARKGVIASGTTLIIESLDRLGRDDLFAQMDVFKRILDAGIRIVALSFGEAEYTSENSHDIGTLLGAIMVMIRAHDESRTKSFRGKENWKMKRAKVDEKILTAAIPLWLRVENGTLVAIPERAAIIKEIFELSLQGNGRRAIAKIFNTRKEPVWASTKRNASQIWQDSYIAKVLHNRAVIGECQPHTKTDGKRNPVGETIIDYYPRVITDELFFAVQKGFGARIHRGGRSVHKANSLFSGLFKCAGCGGPTHIEDKCPGRWVVCRHKKLGATACTCPPIPYTLLETSVLKSLMEIDWAQVVEVDPSKPVTPIQSEESLVDQIGQKRKQLGNLVECIADDKTLYGVIAPKIEELQRDIERACQLVETIRRDRIDRESSHHTSIEGLLALERAIAGELSQPERLRLKTALAAILSHGYVSKGEKGEALAVLVLKNGRIILSEHAPTGERGSVVIDPSHRLEILPGALSIYLPTEQAKIVSTLLEGAA
jgi:DNA invertase Pin-like site-specific DNA recombinase